MSNDMQDSVHSTYEEKELTGLRGWLYAISERCAAAIDWFIEAHPRATPWLRPWVATMIILALLSPFSVTAYLLLIMLATIVAIGCTILAIETVVRHLNAHTERDGFLRVLFAFAHPEHMVDGRQYRSWLKRYRAWYERETNLSFKKLDPWMIAFSAPPVTLDQHLRAYSTYTDMRKLLATRR